METARLDHHKIVAVVEKEMKIVAAVQTEVGLLKRVEWDICVI
jgi:hypothetical protein